MLREILGLGDHPGPLRQSAERNSLGMGNKIRTRLADK